MRWYWLKQQTKGGVNERNNIKIEKVHNGMSSQNQAKHGAGYSNINNKLLSNSKPPWTKGSITSVKTQPAWEE